MFTIVKLLKENYLLVYINVFHLFVRNGKVIMYLFCVSSFFSVLLLSSFPLTLLPCFFTLHLSLHPSGVGIYCLLSKVSGTTNTRKQSRTDSLSFSSAAPQGWSDPTCPCGRERVKYPIQCRSPLCVHDGTVGGLLFGVVRIGSFRSIGHPAIIFLEE